MRSRLHAYFSKKIKNAPTEADARKTQTPIVVTQNLTSIEKTLPIRQVEFAFLPNSLLADEHKNITP